MKLPNFLTFAPFVELKRKMSIPDEVYGDFKQPAQASTLTNDELNKLASGDGLDVYFDELTVLDDGTLAYKDARVLLYIRDVATYGRGRDREPRYHISNCITLQEMTSNGRFERYVIATESTGKFKINHIRNGERRTERRSLSVCQNCLALLNFDGFRFDMNRDQRKVVVSKFTPERFFRVYPKSLHARTPTYNADNSPLNDYSRDWSVRSRAARSAAKWICSDCKENFSAPHMQRFLDVHHKNGQKWDDSAANLIVLCIGCHAKTPNHSHMRNDPRYTAYRRERVTRR